MSTGGTVPTALHASAEHLPRALVWHLQKDQVLANAGSVGPERGFSQRVLRPGGPVDTATALSHDGQGRPSRTGQEALGPPPALPTWTKTSFLHHFPLWFTELQVPSLPPAGSHACRTQTRGRRGPKALLWSWGPKSSAALSHRFLFFHSRAFTSPIVGGGEGSPQSAINILFNNLRAKKKLPRKPERMKGTQLRGR